MGTANSPSEDRQRAEILQALSVPVMLSPIDLTTLVMALPRLVSTMARPQGTLVWPGVYTYQHTCYRCNLPSRDCHGCLVENNSFCFLPDRFDMSLVYVIDANNVHVWFRGQASILYRCDRILVNHRAYIDVWCKLVTAL